ncbi:uncharacterized protein LOC129614278 [Condylostylus longicornis]|uniref:uncharacterized protein LOC129614278 n=1 Tax=Condylostylus longicornis TaxID=2530218 RepID=UPI00244DC872|nr:uncharacterized protein LOC129614278 [Condylostylus longicornis]
MFKTTVISILILCVLYSKEIAAHPASYRNPQSTYALYVGQKLQPKDGYVPVYIRFGDTPLFAINQDLATAFKETEQANNQIQFNTKDIDDSNRSNESNDSKERNDNPIFNTIQDEFSSAKELKRNEKVKNVD